MTRKIKVSAAERRAIRREAAAYKAQHPSNPTNEQYFRTHAAAFGCDPNSKAQARVFSQTLTAICDHRRPTVDGIMTDAMFTAKFRHPTKPDPLPGMWADLMALKREMADEDPNTDFDKLPQYRRHQRLVNGLLFTDATTAEGLAVKVKHIASILEQSNFGTCRERTLESLNRSAANVLRRAVRR